MTQRTDRIDELLKQEIGDLIAREIADPAVGFVTITDVETSPDLRHAKVWVSVIGQPEARQASVQGLQRAMPFVRAQLGRRLRLRRIPEFSVRLDDSVERGSRVLQLLHDLEAGEAPGDVVVGESLPTPRPIHPIEDDERALTGLPTPGLPTPGLPTPGLPTPTPWPARTPKPRGSGRSTGGRPTRRTGSGGPDRRSRDGR